MKIVWVPKILLSAMISPGLIIEVPFWRDNRSFLRLSGVLKTTGLLFAMGQVSCREILKKNWCCEMEKGQSAKFLRSPD